MLCLAYTYVFLLRITLFEKNTCGIDHCEQNISLDYLSKLKISNNIFQFVVSMLVYL